VTCTWAAINLLLVAASEEALFRGVSLRALQNAFGGRAAGEPLAVLATSILFGAAHYRHGGLTYAGLSTMAGLGYGAVVALTQRLEAGIALHFALNAVHFLGFTYPNRASSAELRGLTQGTPLVLRGEVQQGSTPFTS
jgi:membrane protease YdiL (CAAX protease family)